MENLVRRARIVRAIRDFFDNGGFVEVATPVRIAAPAPEPHIDCPAAAPLAPGADPSYLRASPELQMKKLLAAGMDRIYQIGPCFREGELGPRHSPEFTMIEWYRRGEDCRRIRRDAEELFAALARAGLAPAECARPFAEVRVRDAYRSAAGWDPWTDWDQDRFDWDMSTKVEPSLPEGPVVLVDYPPQAASLARLAADPDGTSHAERWELYWRGVELANCFTELCDAPEQRRRFEAAREERRRLGESDYPLDGDFLDLLPLVGSAAGVALGVDRLVMLLCGAKTIHEVMA